jgi:hypothetical protein
MSRLAASIGRKPSEVPSGPYIGICSRLGDTLSGGIEGKEFIESPVSRARPQLTSPEYQERNSVVNRKVKRFRRGGGRRRLTALSALIARLKRSENTMADYLSVRDGIGAADATTGGILGGPQRTRMGKFG